MKILHTADWHLGKILHDLDLQEDHTYFINWLLKYIDDNKIDVLLISGDIFDQNNPTNEARKLYHDTLKQLAEKGVKTIITGGNHDSAKMLNATEGILNLLNIHVVGGMPNSKESLFFELKNKNGDLEAVCIAVPFLRDKDIRQFIPGQTTEQRIQAIKDGIANQFITLSGMVKDKYKDSVPVIAMGHLYIQGANLSEGVRDIQMGNQAGIEFNSFEKLFDYFALGHIHIPKKFSETIRYSGSPIPLSFSEKEDQKIIIQINIQNKQLEILEIPIPKTRDFVLISDDWLSIKGKLKNYKSDTPLPPVFELDIKEERKNLPKIEEELREIISNGVRILKRKVTTLQKEIEEKKYSSKALISEMTPHHILEHLLETKDYESDEKNLIRDAFKELLEIVNEREE